MWVRAAGDAASQVASDLLPRVPLSLSWSHERARSGNAKVVSLNLYFDLLLRAHQVHPTNSAQSASALFKAVLSKQLKLIHFPVTCVPQQKMMVGVTFLLRAFSLGVLQPPAVKKHLAGGQQSF